MGKHPRTWRIYRPKEPCRYALEINSDVVKRTKTEIGDVLEFHPAGDEGKII